MPGTVPGCSQTPTSLTTSAAEEPAPSLGTAGPLAPGTPAACYRHCPLLPSPVAFPLGQADTESRRPTPFAAKHDLSWVLQHLDKEPPATRQSCWGLCFQHGRHAALRAAPQAPSPHPSLLRKAFPGNTVHQLLTPSARGQP